MDTLTPPQQMLTRLLKDGLRHTITSLASALHVSRMSAWRIAKRLEKQEILALQPVGKGKTSTFLVNLRWSSPLLQKTLDLALTQEALQHPRWRNTFAALEPHAGFLVLFGSALHSPKEANDIDILCAYPDKKPLTKGIEATTTIQKTLAKKIHALHLTEKELAEELKKGTPAIKDAVETGVVLFGQESFINLLKSRALHEP